MHVLRAECCKRRLTLEGGISTCGCLIKYLWQRRSVSEPARLVVDKREAGIACVCTHLNSDVVAHFCQPTIIKWGKLKRGPPVPAACAVRRQAKSSHLLTSAAKSDWVLARPLLLPPPLSAANSAPPLSTTMPWPLLPPAVAAVCVVLPTVSPMFRGTDSRSTLPVPLLSTAMLCSLLAKLALSDFSGVAFDLVTVWFVR